MTDEEALAQLKDAVVTIKAVLAHFEAKSATLKLGLARAHTLANDALLWFEGTVGLQHGSMGAHPNDGTPKK